MEDIIYPYAESGSTQKEGKENNSGQFAERPDTGDARNPIQGDFKRPENNQRSAEKV